MLLLSAGPGGGPASGFGAVPAPAQGEPERVALVVADPDGGVARSLRRAGGDVWHDAGGMVVCGESPETRAALAGEGLVPSRAVSLETRESLYVLSPPDEDGARWLGRAGARVVARQEGQWLCALDRRAEWLLATMSRDRGFHCGYARLAERSLAPPLAGDHLSSPDGATRRALLDPRIQAAVQGVEANALERATAWLSGLTTTRLSSSQGARDARAALRGVLAGIVPSTRIQGIGGGFAGNVVGEIPGSRDPNKIVVIGAHYDSINAVDGPNGPAPGADDNASGVAGVLEAARALRAAGPYQHTLRFVLFSGEEQGLVGSVLASNEALANGEEILAMFNLDMIAYRAPGDARDVDLATNNTSPELTDLIDSVGAAYVPNWSSSRGPLLAGFSDHQSYDSNGWPAAFLFEDRTDFFPTRHTALDRFPDATNDFELAQMITRGAVAAAAVVARPLEFQIGHVALPDTADAGPFQVTAQVTSVSDPSGGTPELTYRINGGPRTVAPMTPSAGVWSAGIPAVPEGGLVEYRIAFESGSGRRAFWPEATDGLGTHTFLVGTPTQIFQRRFDGATDGGWTHGATVGTDDWERGRPRGRALDPPRAFSGNGVWGTDLGLAGDGRYGASSESWLRSPVVDLSSVQPGERVVLELSRWLTLGVGDEARVAIEGGGVAWTRSVRTRDLEWGRGLVDLTPALRPGASGARLEFWLESDERLEAGGWTLDDVRVLRLAPPGP